MPSGSGLRPARDSLFQVLNVSTGSPSFSTWIASFVNKTRSKPEELQAWRRRHSARLSMAAKVRDASAPVYHGTAGAGGAVERGGGEGGWVGGWFWRMASWATKSWLSITALLPHFSAEASRHFRRTASGKGHAPGLFKTCPCRAPSDFFLRRGSGQASSRHTAVYMKLVLRPGEASFVEGTAGLLEPWPGWADVGLMRTAFMASGFGLGSSWAGILRFAQFP